MVRAQWCVDKTKRELPRLISQMKERIVCRRMHSERSREREIEECRRFAKFAETINVTLKYTSRRVYLGCLFNKVLHENQGINQEKVRDK